MPETVLPLHHTTLRAAGAQASSIAEFALVTNFTFQQQVSGSWHISGATRQIAPVLRNVSTILRC